MDCTVAPEAEYFLFNMSYLVAYAKQILRMYNEFVL